MRSSAPSMRPNLLATTRFVPAAVRDRLRPYRQIATRIRAERPNLHLIAFGRSSFSQFGEDQFLARRFAAQPEGFYVDVGAFHPFSWSNTCLLYRRGWRGLNIEPDPEAISLFERHRPRDLNVQLAVSSTPGEARFARSGEYAGIENEHYLWPDRDAPRIVVATQPLAAILEERLPPGQQIDLLDVDCEGLDLDVLQSNDWQRFRPTVVFAEAHDHDSAARITSLMLSVGYRHVTQFHLTLVFEAN
jgi:FkbM family methyltransferase